MSLADNMRTAADTLIAANERMGLSPNGTWRPSELRAEAEQVETEDQEHTAQQHLLGLQLARQLITALTTHHPHA